MIPAQRTQARTEIKRHFALARTLLNQYVEDEMFRLMREHPRIEVLLKCMGELTAYRRENVYGVRVEVNSHEFACLRPLQDFLNEYDTDYSCRTGRPLKITRGSPDRTALHHTRYW